MRVSLLVRLSAGVLLFNFLAGRAPAFEETFASNPADRGWKAAGEASLFSWSATAGALAVAWNSSRTNSYFALPLGMVLTRSNDFAVEFDLLLRDFRSGSDPSKPNPFQVAAGFVNLSAASGPGFFRGSGYQNPHLVEFSFFPDPGGAWQWGPSLTVAAVDGTGTNWSTGGFAPGGLESNTVYRVSLAFDASRQGIRASIRAGNQLMVEFPEARLGEAFTDFALDHFAICSYSDAGQDPAYAGSILAHGVVDNILLRLPGGPRLELMVPPGGASVRAEFAGASGWRYALERSTDLSTWGLVSDWVSGRPERMRLEDPQPPVSAFYRVRAAKE